MQSRRGAVVILALLAFGALVCHSQQADESLGGDNFELDLDNYGYGEDMDDYLSDDSGYYGNDDNMYYDYHGYYPEDYDGGYMGYDDEDYEEFIRDCSFDDKGKPQLRNGTTSCPIKIAGVDKQAGNLPGGIDGLYDLISCYNGKALYRRRNTSETEGAEGRVLWYSDIFGDWDLSRGNDPNEAEIMLYGGEHEHAVLPLLVSNWHLHSPTSKQHGSKADYKPIKVQISCADGTKLKKEQIAEMQRQAQERQSTGPMLTQDEWDKKYKEVYEKFGRHPDPNPAVSFTFVVLLVMIGLTIVLAIPFFLVKKKSNGKASISTSFSQMLQQSKKKQSGHAN